MQDSAPHDRTLLRRTFLRAIGAGKLANQVILDKESRWTLGIVIGETSGSSTYLSGGNLDESRLPPLPPEVRLGYQRGHEPLPATSSQLDALSRQGTTEKF